MILDFSSELHTAPVCVLNVRTSAHEKSRELDQLFFQPSSPVSSVVLRKNSLGRQLKPGPFYEFVSYTTPNPVELIRDFRGHMPLILGSLLDLWSNYLSDGFLIVLMVFLPHFPAINSRRSLYATQKKLTNFL